MSDEIKNYLNDSILARFNAAKLTFALGTHERVGLNSSLRLFYAHRIFDFHLLPLIFNFLDYPYIGVQ